jgi:hypothetical protein
MYLNGCLQEELINFRALRGVTDSSFFSAPLFNIQASRARQWGRRRRVHFKVNASWRDSPQRHQHIHSVPCPDSSNVRPASKRFRVLREISHFPFAFLCEALPQPFFDRELMFHEIYGWCCLLLPFTRMLKFNSYTLLAPFFYFNMPSGWINRKTRRWRRCAREKKVFYGSLWCDCFISRSLSRFVQSTANTRK